MAPPPDIKGAPPAMASPQYRPTPTVYYYTNPQTHQNIASLLPPDHPEMVCLQAGGHVRVTRYGILGKHSPFLNLTFPHLFHQGIVAAVIWFPLGIGLCLLDRKVKCARCGLVVNEGFFD